MKTYIYTTFAFGKESKVVQSEIEGFRILFCALISFVEPGMNFVKEEEILNINNFTYVLEGVTTSPAVHLCL